MIGLLQSGTGSGTRLPISAGMKFKCRPASAASTWPAEYWMWRSPLRPPRRPPALGAAAAAGDAQRRAGDGSRRRLAMPRGRRSGHRWPPGRWARRSRSGVRALPRWPCVPAVPPCRSPCAGEPARRAARVRWADRSSGRGAVPRRWPAPPDGAGAGPPRVPPAARRRGGRARGRGARRGGAAAARARVRWQPGGRRPRRPWPSAGRRRGRSPGWGWPCSWSCARRCGLGPPPGPVFCGSPGRRGHACAGGWVTVGVGSGHARARAGYARPAAEGRPVAATRVRRRRGPARPPVAPWPPAGPGAPSPPARARAGPRQPGRRRAADLAPAARGARPRAR